VRQLLFFSLHTLLRPRFELWTFKSFYAFCVWPLTPCPMLCQKTEETPPPFFQLFPFLFLLFFKGRAVAGPPFAAPKRVLLKMVLRCARFHFPGWESGPHGCPIFLSPPLFGLLPLQTGHDGGSLPFLPSAKCLHPSFSGVLPPVGAPMNANPPTLFFSLEFFFLQKLRWSPLYVWWIFWERCLCFTPPAFSALRPPIGPRGNPSPPPAYPPSPIGSSLQTFLCYKNNPFSNTRDCLFFTSARQ